PFCASNQGVAPMPKLSRALPKYRKHRGSGQAVVTLSGLDHYLGPHGTKASKVEYDRLIAEWLQNGRQLQAPADGSMAIGRVIAAYMRHARAYYRKSGKPTSEVAGIVHALRFVKLLYGHTQVAEFGPLSLQAVRGKLVEAGHARRTVNQAIGRIRRMF